MSDEQNFHELISRVRGRDQAAAAELVRRYEAVIRVAVRVRLGTPALRRLLDSTDVCQSVLASFFTRAALGEYELDSPQQLLALLARMARNKLLNQARHERAACRDHRRREKGAVNPEELAGRCPDPGETVANREVVAKLHARLSEEDRWLADQRALGRPWADLAAEMGTRPDALRMRLTRAVDEAARSLGLEEYLQ
jgi:RNA polymerase sigma-70 factor (ECF subfamily)